MPVDIFPEIDIPVVRVVWTYAGMSPQDIQNRIPTLHERQLASLVDDIARIEATSYAGVAARRPDLGRKTGGVSTPAVVDGVREALPDIRKLMPPGVDIQAIFDQSAFVKASLNSVLIGGAMAAGLTAMMIPLGCSSSFRTWQPWAHSIPSWKPKIVRSTPESIVATRGTIRAMIAAASDEREIGQCR
jgi:multidrug efflux pump subunit AcrB